MHAEAHPMPVAAQAILSASHVLCRFGGVTAVDVERIDIERGSITALIGPNGAGKSTLFNVLTGFDRADFGRWSLEGRELSRMSAQRIAQHGLVRTFQLTASLSRLTVLENMMLGAKGQRGESLLGALWPPGWRAQERRIEQAARALLERFKLLHLASSLAGVLSGGQRKLLELARALMTQPRVLLLDEPMAGVNPVLREALLEHLREVHRGGTTLVLIEHDMALVRDISQRVICMAAGRIVASGSARGVAEDPIVIDAYLGTRTARPHAAVPARGRATPLQGSSAVMSIQGLVAGYVPGFDILRGIDLSLAPAEIVGIFGPNGAGKSTLLKAIVGAADVRSGSMLLRGENLVGRPTHALVADGLGYVPQVNNVFTRLSVEENLRMGLFLAPRLWNERLALVLQLFPALAPLLRTAAGNLSGGERQMVAFARALMMKPSVLLLDEPSAGLSPRLQDQVFDFVLETRRQGVAIVIVEQNARRCLQVCDRGYMLDQGRCAYTGSGNDLLNDPRIVELYLGSLGARATDPVSARNDLATAAAANASTFTHLPTQGPLP